MSSSSKSRQPRLRASCDGCFLAKVKCSKARPICSRCLACGIECRYSPSSRAGKHKSDSASAHIGSSNPEFSESQHFVDDGFVCPPYTTQPSEYTFRVETGWTTPPVSSEGSLSRSHSATTGLAPLATEDGGLYEADPMSAPGEMYAATLPWTPPNDVYGAYGDLPLANTQLAHVRSNSLDASFTTPATWAEPTSQDMMAYAQIPTPASLSSTYFPSPSATPAMGTRPVPSRHKSRNGSAGSGGSCTCFTVCLQSLQALHNASSPASPPFDLVLSLNRKAVEGCAAMLACSRCMGRSGTHTAAMLLATIIGKITSFYRNASQAYFEAGGTGPSIYDASNGGVGVSVGAYQLHGEDGRWLELEILNRELRKLEEVYSRFREVCADLSDDPEVSKAMIGYLGHNLGSTLEVVSHRR